jgi:hypothetical protein
MRSEKVFLIEAEEDTRRVLLVSLLRPGNLFVRSTNPLSPAGRAGL